MSPLDLTTAALAAQPVIAGENDELTTSLLDSAPEFAPSPTFFERFERLRNYNGPVRTEISDVDWDVLRAGLKAFAACKLTDEVVGFIAQALVSIKESRPAEQLFRDFCAAAGYELAFEQWYEYKDRKPTEDYRSAFSAVFSLGDWSALSDPPKIPAGRFSPRIPDLNAPIPEWIIKGVIQERTLVMMYGRWGTGKSTLAIEISGAIAQGKPWHGHKVKQGRVIYIASEDAYGTRARLRALLKDQGITLDDLDGRFLEIVSRPHLLKPDEIQELIRDLTPFGPSLIVIDTLSRATAGADENSVKDMSLAIENAQSIINATGASVLFIHHTGKDESRGARGSSALPGGVDTEIVLARPDNTQNLRTAKLGKARGVTDYSDLFDYELKDVELAVDSDGDPIKSMVVREVEPKAQSTLKIVELPNTPTRRAIRSVLSENQRAVPFEEMLDKVKGLLAPPDPGTKDRRRDRIKQTAERMMQDHELHIAEDGMVSLVDPSMPFTPVQADQYNGDLIDERDAA